MTTFLTIFWRFQTTLQRCPKIFQNFSEGKTNFSEHFSYVCRRLPKISDDNRRFPRRARWCFDHKATHLGTWMVIILVTAAAPISSHVKDKKKIFSHTTITHSRYYGHQIAVPRVSAITGVDCIFTANDEDMIFKQKEKSWYFTGVYVIKRGYYRVAWRYEFYVRVARMISRE